MKKFLLIAVAILVAVSAMGFYGGCKRKPQAEKPAAQAPAEPAEEESEEEWEEW